MKKTLFLSLLGLLLLGCQKDNIVLIDPISVDDSDDDITNTTFAQTVLVAFSENANATVEGTNDDFTVTVSNNDVTIVYTGDEYVMYELSGGTTDGFFKLYSPRKQGITLNGVSIANPNGAAINVQGPQATPNKGKRTFVVINGTNSLYDGASYTETPSEEDEKGVLFGEGQFIFSGEGRLYVTATGKNGIVSDDYLNFKSGEIYVTSSAGHGIRGKDCILVSGGEIQVGVSADMKKGFSTDGYVVIDGGTTSINVTGGTAYDSEDGEYTGSAGIKADGYFKMNGGGLTITNTGTGGKVTWFVQNRSGGHFHIDTHLISYDMRQCGFTKTWRAVEQDMIQGLPSHFGRFDINIEIRHYLLLASEIFQFPRADNSVQILIFVSVCVARIEVCHQRVNYQIQIY